MLATLGELTELWVVFNGNRGSIILIHRDNKPCVSGAVKGGGGRKTGNSTAGCGRVCCAAPSPAQLVEKGNKSPLVLIHLQGELYQLVIIDRRVNNDTGHTLLRSLLGDDYQMLVSSLPLARALRQPLKVSIRSVPFLLGLFRRLKIWPSFKGLLL